MTAGKGREKLLDLLRFLSPLQRQRHQPQPSHPAFGAGFQARRLPRRERERDSLLEESLGFCQGKA